MTTIQKYIIIDDDPFNNMICKLLIGRILSATDINTFDIPEKGLAYLKNEYAKNPAPAILFLDINMPTLSCWDFLEQFEELEAAIKSQISIYILSSSIDPKDRHKTEANKFVKGFISKPLNRDTLVSIAGDR